MGFNYSKQERFVCKHYRYYRKATNVSLALRAEDIFNEHVKEACQSPAHFRTIFYGAFGIFFSFCFCKHLRVSFGAATSDI